MKHFLTLFLAFFALHTLSAQQSEDLQFKSPIFPGCEKHKENKEQLACFQKNVTSLFVKYLEKYINSFEYLNLQEVDAKLILELKENGEINLRDIDTNSSLFKGYGALAFNKFKEELSGKKLKIKPAISTLTDKPLDMLVSFPIDFKLNHVINETDTRLIAVLEDENDVYEIVITPEKELKIYQQNEIKPIYLGKYSSIQEIKETLPYQTLINQSNQLITLAQADFGKVSVILQTLNVFNEDEFYTLFVVSEVKGKRVKQLRKYTSLDDFFQSPYYNWLSKVY